MRPLVVVAAVLALGMGFTHARAEERYRLTVAPGADSLLFAGAAARADSATLWSRDQLQALAARIRDRLLAQGRIGASVRLTITPGAPEDSVDAARLVVGQGATRATRLLPVVRGGED